VRTAAPEHRQSLRAIERHVYPPAAVLAAALIGPASGIPLATCMLIISWLGDALKRDRADRCLCLTCEATFDGTDDPTSHDWSIVVITPMAEEGTAIVSGLCRACAEKCGF
jgi:hypothetical protein